jgi:prepilin-type N-terminal cleavage/methylation domain-containing protein
MRAPRSLRSERGFTLVEALAALAIFAIAVLVAAAFLQAHVQAAKRLEVRSGLMHASEITLEEIRSGIRPMTSATIDRTGELDLPRAAAVTTTIKVDGGGVTDLYHVMVSSRSAAAGEPMVVTLETKVWRP